MSSVHEDSDAAPNQHPQNADQEPLIGQQLGYRSSEDEDVTSPASTSGTLWQKPFL